MRWQYCGSSSIAVVWQSGIGESSATLAVWMPPKAAPTFRRHHACHPVLIRGRMVGCPERAPGTRGTLRCDTTSVVTNHFLAGRRPGHVLPVGMDVRLQRCDLAALRRTDDKTQRAWRASSSRVWSDVGQASTSSMCPTTMHPHLGKCFDEWTDASLVSSLALLAPSNPNFKVASTSPLFCLSAHQPLH